MLTFLIFALIKRGIAQQPSVDTSQSVSYQSYTKEELQDKIDKANYLLFKELFDSAQAVISPVVGEIGRRNLLESELGLQARFTAVSAQSLTEDKELALESVHELIDVFKSTKDWLMLSRAYLIAEQILDALNMPENSFSYLKACEELIQTYNIEKTYPWFCIRMYRFYKIQGDEAKSFYYIEEALKSSKRLYELQNEVYSKQKYDDVSLEYATANTLMGVYYQKKGDKVNAQFYLEEATRVYQKVKNDFNMLWTYYFLARMQMEIGDLDLALVYSSLCQYLNSNIFEEYGFHGKYLQYHSAFLRSDIYEKLGQVDSAFVYHKLGYDIQIILEENKYNESLVKIETKYADELKTLKISKQKEQLKKEGRLRNWLIIVILLFFVLTGMLIYFFKKLGESKRRTELQAIELREVDDLKSNLFTNISHELKTPVALIMGPLNYLLDKKDNWDEASVRDQLGVMQRNGQGLIDLIEEILDLSKLDVGKLELKEELTDAKFFFEDILETFIPKIESNNLSFNYVSSLDGPLFLMLDRLKVKKIINNLLFNAIKFTPEKGHIEVLVRHTEERFDFIVTDSGYGIEEKDLGNIFKPYFQSNPTSRKTNDGSGLGLSLSKEYAKLMGGDILVESVVSKGSKFSFSMPLKNVDSPTQIIDHDVSSPFVDGSIYEIGTNYNILVVEDNEDMRQFLALVLEPKYQKVYLAKNGEEGLDFLKKHSDIDLIISDMMMPEMDGITMVQTLKDNPTWKSIPIIMLTAINTERDKLKALTIGIDDYITKPFSIQELLVRVQNLLFSHQGRLDWKNNSEDSAQVFDLDHEINQDDNAFLDTLQEFIESYPTEEKLTVDVLAEHVFYSSKKLTRKLKALTGLSTAKYIKEVRLMKAKRLLEEGREERISDIAYKSGFDNLTTFSAVFKTRFGASPLRYTKQIKKMSQDV